MVACRPNDALDGGDGAAAAVVLEVAQVQEDLVDGLAGPEDLVHSADAVGIGHLVVDDAVALEVAQAVGEPLVVALDVGHRPQLAAQGHDLGRQLRVAPGCGPGPAAACTFQSRAPSQAISGVCSPSCWWKGRIVRGGRDETSTTSTPPSRTLAMVRLARSEMCRGPDSRVPSRSMKTRRITRPVPTSWASPRAT